MKHQLIVLVGGVERVCARGVGCNTGQDRAWRQGHRPQYKKATVLGDGEVKLMM